MNKIMMIAGAVFLLTLSAGLGFITHQHFQSDTNVSNTSALNTTVKKDVLGFKRPDFSLLDLDGKERHVSEWDGKVLVINFWATWCPPCLEEIPAFIQLQEEFADKGLQFLGIALQDAEEVRPFYTEHGMNYPSLVGQEEVIRIASTLGNDLGALPYTVFIDSSGLIEFVKRGPISAEKAREVIENLL